MSRPIFALLLFVGWAAASCRQAPQVYKVGLVAPFEGRQRRVGYDAVYAARLAVREANQGEFLESGRVLLVALDDGGEPELARQAAASLIVDPDVVAVVGHWSTDATNAARPLYRAAGLPLVETGTTPFTAFPAGELTPAFRESYAAITPFDEVAGPRAGPTYDALYLVLNALKVAEMDGEIGRGSVGEALEGLEYEGLTGRVYRP